MKLMINILMWTRSNIQQEEEVKHSLACDDSADTNKMSETKNILTRNNITIDVTTDAGKKPIVK